MEGQLLDPSPSALALQMIKAVEENSVMLTRMVERVQHMHDVQMDHQRRLEGFTEVLFAGSQRQDSVQVRLVKLEERQGEYKSWHGWFVGVLTTLLLTLMSWLGWSVWQTVAQSKGGIPPITIESPKVNTR